MGPLNTSACQLFGNLGRKISLSSGDDREGAFLFQRVSELVQRFNAVLLHDSRQLANPWLHGLIDLYPILYILIFKLPREHIYRGSKKIIIITAKLFSNNKQVCVEPRPSALNMTLPAFAAERGLQACQLSIDICCRRPLQLAARRCCCRSTGQTDGRTDGQPTVT